MTCILIWLGVTLTLIRPFYIYQFPYGQKRKRVSAALFLSLLWPWAVFMIGRRKYLEYAITESQINA